MAEEEKPQQPQGPETPKQAEQAAPAAAEIPKDAKTMAMLCHLLAIFTGFIGPLIIWLVKKDDHPFIDEQGKESLNFQITVLLAMIASFLLTFVCVGAFLMPAVGIVDLVFCIIATIKVNGGEHYRYPICLRLVK
jgi:uncharacterized Tic20 family protein